MLISVSIAARPTIQLGCHWARPVLMEGGPQPGPWFAQYDIAADSVGKGCSQEDVRRKVRRGSNPLDAGHGCQPVSNHRHPGMPLSVSSRKDGGHRKGAGGMAGREAAPIEIGPLRLEPRVGVVAVRGDVTWVKPAINASHHAQQKIRVSKGLSGEKGSLLHIGVVSRQAGDIPNHGKTKKNPFRRRDLEDLMEGQKVVSATKIGCVVGIERYQTCRNPGDGEGGFPMLALGQVKGKKPNSFLIAEKVGKYKLPGYSPGEYPGSFCFPTFSAIRNEFGF